MTDLQTKLRTNIKDLSRKELEKYIVELRAMRIPKRKTKRAAKKEVIDMQTLTLMAKDFGISIEAMKNALLQGGNVEIEDGV